MREVKQILCLDVGEIHDGVSNALFRDRMLAAECPLVAVHQAFMSNGVKEPRPSITNCRITSHVSLQHDIVPQTFFDEQREYRCSVKGMTA